MGEDEVSHLSEAVGARGYLVDVYVPSLSRLLRSDVVADKGGLGHKYLRYTAGDDMWPRSREPDTASQSMANLHKRTAGQIMANPSIGLAM